MLNSIKRAIVRSLPDAVVIARYKATGLIYGDECSYAFVGECSDRNERKWAFWEEEYARRGYRTVPPADLQLAGGWGRDLDPLLGIKRGQLEEAILYSQETSDTSTLPSSQQGALQQRQRNQ